VGGANEGTSLMPNTSAGAGKVSWLAEPTYGYASSDGGPYLPTPREVIREWLDAINVVANRNRGSALLFVVFHLLTAVIFVALGLPNSPLVSEIHWFSAYWVISLNSNQGGIPRIARPACCNPA